MANAKRGLIEIELGGELREMRFPLSIMKVLQQHFKVKNIDRVWQTMDGWSAENWSVVILHGLRKGSMEEATADEVDDMVSGTELMYYKAILADAMLSSCTGRDFSPQLQALIDTRINEATKTAEVVPIKAVNPQ